MTKIAIAAFSAGLALAAGIASATAAPCDEPNAIAKVRNRAPAGAYEYVVFDFIKPPAAPNFSVTTVSPPFTEDPSDRPITIAGARFKQIRFDSVVWTCEIAEAFALPRRAIKGIARTGQFEGVISYVVGYRRASRFAGYYSYDAGRYLKIVLKFRK